MKRLSSRKEFLELGRVAVDFGGVEKAFSDSGWQPVTSLLTNGWTATTVEIRRDGNHSAIRFTGLNGAAATSTYFLQNLPVGFFEGNQNIPTRVGNDWANIWVQSNGRNLSIPTATPPASLTTVATQYVGGLAYPTSMPGGS